MPPRSTTILRSSTNFMFHPLFYNPLFTVNHRLADTARLRPSRSQSPKNLLVDSRSESKFHISVHHPGALPGSCPSIDCWNGSRSCSRSPSPRPGNLPKSRSFEPDANCVSYFSDDCTSCFQNVACGYLSHCLTSSLDTDMSPPPGFERANYNLFTGSRISDQFFPESVSVISNENCDPDPQVVQPSQESQSSAIAKPKVLLSTPYDTPCADGTIIARIPNTSSVKNVYQQIKVRPVITSLTQ